MEANLFLKEKPEDGLRIFVQGGSTAAGFPYGFGASPAGMLDQRLGKTFPNRTVEVINTAMSAVNSYTLLDFVDEIIEQQPDAVLIYTGHNEFLGILGVGSNYTATNSHAANLMFLKLRGFRIFQLVQNITGQFSIIFADSNEKIMTETQTLKNSRTMMAKVAKRKRIEKNSAIYRNGLIQFEDNLNLILTKYKSAKIPVLISTIASNLRDHPPFSSVTTSDTDRLVLINIHKSIKSGSSFTEQQTEITRLSKTASLNNNAYIYFQLAEILDIAGRHKQAKIFYVAAKEHDLLRFRATDDINKIISNLAKEHKAVLVDYESNLSKSSPNGIVGNNFMLEHLHPNLQGYFILADSFYRKLKSEELFGDWNGAITTSQAWKERPVIAAEEYAGFAKIIQLKSDYPYTDKPKKVILPKPADWQQEIGIRYYSKKIDWLEMLNQSYKGYLDRRNIPMVLKTSEMIADAMPQNAITNFRVAKQQLQEGNTNKSLQFLDRALAEEPNNKKYNSLKLKLSNR
jgi:tetratricopeptide (TPR) repeat protein/Fe-S cluster assembly iron-binding protein IscA